MDGDEDQDTEMKDIRKIFDFWGGGSLVDRKKLKTKKPKK